jgi:uncharacterized protein YodC (DUF2158 family)
MGYEAKMTQKFNPGDVVRLKSGGPDMTVASYGSQMHDGQPYCRWFDGNRRMQDYFNDAELELVEAPQAGPVLPAVKRLRTPSGRQI